MPPITVSFDITDAQQKRLDAITAALNKSVPEGAPRHSRQTFLAGVVTEGVEAALAKAEKELPEKEKAKAAAAKGEKSTSK